MKTREAAIALNITRKSIRLTVIILMLLAMSATIHNVCAAPLENQSLSIHNAGSGSISITAGKTFLLYASAKTALSFKSSNQSVATVSQRGKVVAKRHGTTVITITAQKGKGYKAATKKIKIEVKRKQQKFKVKDVTLKAGMSVTKPVTGLKTAFHVKSSDTTIATVEKTSSRRFKVSAITPGKAVIHFTISANTKFDGAGFNVAVTVTGEESRSAKGRSGDQAIEYSDSQHIAGQDRIVTSTNIRNLAPRMDARVLDAFEKLNFKVVIDPDYYASGHIIYQERTIFLREANDVIYHELGHFLYCISDHDSGNSFESIYLEEYARFPGKRKVYAYQKSSEFYAECTREFVFHGRRLQQACPRTYEYIQKNILEISDVRLHMIDRIL